MTAPSSAISTGSAWREIPIAEAWERARRAATLVGISRITDITRLDRLGVPVAVAIRPGAAPHGLCVSAGKGLTLADAYTGAAMEGVELAFAEPGAAGVPVAIATAADVLDGEPGGIERFGTRAGEPIDLAAPYPVVVAEDLATGRSCRVPAEAIFFPFLHPRAFLGSHTNGLSSGSSVAEATLHGLAEAIERDAYSFALLQPPILIDPATLPEPVAGLDGRLRARGFAVWWFQLPNPFGVPCVSATLCDLDDRRVPTSGQGCHLSPVIAAVRAITEAIQSRASFIHAGRDDLGTLLAHKPMRGWDEMAEANRAAQEALRDAGTVAFSALPDAGAAAPSIGAATALLRARLAAAGLPRVLRVVLTPPDFPMQVVRVVVPGLERHAHDPSRSGPRLRAFRGR